MQNEATVDTFRWPMSFTGAALLRSSALIRSIIAFLIVAAAAMPFVAHAAPGSGENEFRSVFMSWKKLDTVGKGAISIPSIKPVSNFTFTSSFGIRSDPFRGAAAMHAGIDLAGPTGTPIYATADGYVSRAEWWGGYGNMVELNHGKGIATRYGHMSRIVAEPGQFVKRGELIGMVGSTGRSTGSHLHYEVRIDGRAVNPIPFLQSADYMAAMEKQSARRTALGGPDE